MSLPRILEFQKSITRELLITKDRVEFLIGDANWGDVGRYKEAILRKIISQFLPTTLKIGTGFIIGNNDHYTGLLNQVSSQLDIIIYDDNSPVVFREGDFVIVTESAVRAVIEVKTGITNHTRNIDSGNDSAFNKIIAKLNRLRVFESFNPDSIARKKFVGVFAYNYTGNFTDERIDEVLKLSDGLVNHVALGPNNFIRYWKHTSDLVPPIPYYGRCYIRYNLIDLSFSYFISNLLHIVSDEDPTDRYWFSFPIEGTKERHRTEQRAVIPLPDNQ